MSAYPVTNASGEVRLVTEHVRDITERKQAEKALRQSEDRFRVLFEQAADSILLLEIMPDGVPVIRDANGATFRLLGYERDELIGQRISSVDAAPDPSKVVDERRRSASSGEGQIFEASHRCKDGTILEFECSVTEIRIGSKTFGLSVERDITARKRASAEREKLEEQLRMSQRMDAIGSLAGGIAHDFNNILSVILSYTQFAMDGLKEGDRLKDDLLQVKNAGERAAALTRQLLAFSRKQVLQPVPLDLNQIAIGIEKMLRRILGEDIDYVQVLAPNLGLTLADPSQIEQVLMNLVVNARDAMPEGGMLTIETRNVELDEEYAAAPRGREARRLRVARGHGHWLRHGRADQGADLRAVLHDQGKGQGNRPRTVHRIRHCQSKRRHHLGVQRAGTGNHIQDYHAASGFGPRGGPPDRSIVPRRFKGTETVLVVEDEEALREVARRTLDGAGYTVLPAKDGDEALRVSAQHRRIHLLLTDVVMPRMSGKALAQELLKTRPKLKVLYMSGYTDNSIVHHGVLDPGTHFLAKPFTAHDLKRKVREVLDGGITIVADGRESATLLFAQPKENPPDKNALASAS